MADRGFTIDDLLFPLKVKLNIPAFTKGKDKLSEEEINRDKTNCNCTDSRQARYWKFKSVPHTKSGRSRYLCKETK